MKRVLFLFNHDAAHQVAHLAGIAAATAAQQSRLAVIIAYASPAMREQIEALMPDQAKHHVTWVELEVRGFSGAIARRLDRLFPATRLLRLKQYAPLFGSCDAIVSSERTFLRIKQHLASDAHPLFIKIPHGAGDRAVTFHEDNTSFDLLLVSGSKFQSEFVKAGVDPDRIAVVGYPKFEGIDFDAHPRLFANDRPVFVYNPHFDPHLSSWFDDGPDLLRWFAGAEGQQYNCIFAPHVMLFKKRWHFSLEHRKLRTCPPVPPEAVQAENILIDTGSPRSFDMSYMLASDAYIGDASSQIYEFIAEPRAAFFLDPRSAIADERSSPPLYFGAGPVAASLDELTTLLPRHTAIADTYRDAQKALFNDTFDICDRPSTHRAAEAIGELLAKAS